MIRKQNLNKNNKISSWILDPGASLHITNSISSFKNLKYCNENIILPNGNIVTSLKRGDFIGYLNNNKFISRNDHFVPYITKNIISVTKLIQQYYKVIFFNNKNHLCTTIYDQYGNRINLFSNEQNTFIIWLSTNPIIYNKPNNTPIHLFHLSRLSIPDKIKLWHRRLGHFYIDPIKNKLLKLILNQNVLFVLIQN